jgi:hypothetical protein
MEMKMTLGNETINLMKLIILSVDLLTFVTLFTVWLALKRAALNGTNATLFVVPLVLAIPLVLALSWGLLWTLNPTLSAMRLLPPPFGQAGGILGLVVGLTSLLFLPAVRAYFKTADIMTLATVGPWRALYGFILLVIGLMGGLPAAFFWSAAAGDIIAGLWALSLIPRRDSVTQKELLAWNILGLLDLLHVLAVGAINLRPFYLASPEIPGLNLLPLVGVPVFIALHAMTLFGMIARRKVGEHSLRKGRTAVAAVMFLIASIGALVASVQPSEAQQPSPQLTDKEQSSCRSDAIRLCFFSLANAENTRACLRSKKPDLSQPCRKLIEARGN